MFLAVLIFSFPLILSAYACSSMFAESDAFSNSLSSGNSGREALCVSRLSKVASCFLAPAPSLNLRATILRC